MVVDAAGEGPAHDEGRNGENEQERQSREETNARQAKAKQTNNVS
jgi:hypothetical protein